MPTKFLKDSSGRLYTDAITKKPIAVDMPDIQNDGKPLEVTTEEEMTALITTENEGKIVLYSGETGEYVNGEYYKITSSGDNTQYYELAELANPATAEDIANGKEAYGADGAVITGTAESGGTEITGEVTAKSTTEISFADIPMQPKCVILENSTYGSKKIYAAFSSCYAGSTALRIVHGTTYTMWTGGTIPTTYDSNTKTLSIGVGSSGATFLTGTPYKYKIVY